MGELDGCSIGWREDYPPMWEGLYTVEDTELTEVALKQ